MKKSIVLGRLNPTMSARSKRQASFSSFSATISLRERIFEKSVALSSLDEGSGVQLAYTLLKLGKRKEAQAILNTACKIDVMTEIEMKVEQMRAHAKAMEAQESI